MTRHEGIRPFLHRVPGADGWAAAVRHIRDGHVQWGTYGLAPYALPWDHAAQVAIRWAYRCREAAAVEAGPS